ncbi:MAG: hypothetical protein M3R52_00265, partial [Acidobacteriota bacterium]|nr:hypothetical protein [Acidobacteriota bacterium]
MLTLPKVDMNRLKPFLIPLLLIAFLGLTACKKISAPANQTATSPLGATESQHAAGGTTPAV